jgi:hypothetical protein
LTREPLRAENTVNAGSLRIEDAGSQEMIRRRENERSEDQAQLSVLFADGHDIILERTGRPSAEIEDE